MYMMCILYVKRMWWNGSLLCDQTGNFDQVFIYKYGDKV